MTAPASGHDARRLARLREHLGRQLTYYLLHFVEGDHTWGQTRLTAAVVVGVLFVLLSRLFETIEHQPVFNWVVDQLLLRELLPPRLISLMGLFASFFSIQVLRHALPPLLGFALALYFGATYLRDLLAYWADGFDWRAQEGRLNRFEHHLADVDGFQIHFVHHRGQGYVYLRALGIEPPPFWERD